MPCSAFIVRSQGHRDSQSTVCTVAITHMPQGTQEHPHDRRGVIFCHCTLTTTSNAYRWQLRRGFTKPQTGAQGMGVSLCESTTHTTRCKQRNATAYPCLHHRVWIPRAVKIQCNAAGRRKSQLEHMRTAIVSAHRWSNPAHTTATRQSWAMPVREITRTHLLARQKTHVHLLPRTKLQQMVASGRWGMLKLMHMLNCKNTNF